MAMLREKFGWMTLLAGMLVAAVGHAFEGIEGRALVGLLGPEIKDPAAERIGVQMLDRPFRGLFGGDSSLYDTLGTKATVVVVRDLQCPVSSRYGPRVAKMARQLESKGVRFVYLYLNRDIPEVRLILDANRLAAPGAYISHGGYKIAQELGVESAGDVFVLDADGRLMYRGAIDDQYGLGYTRAFPTQKYLQDAVEAVTAGNTVQVPATTAPGCWIDADPEKDNPYESLPFAFDEEGYTLKGFGHRNVANII